MSTIDEVTQKTKDFTLTDLIMRANVGGNTRTLEEDYIFTNGKYKITVKKGFVTDGASIPRIFWSIIGGPFEGPLLFAAVVHDGLYTKMELPREECDGILKEIYIELATRLIESDLISNIESGMSKQKANIIKNTKLALSKTKAEAIYTAVRIGGGSHWVKDTTSTMYLVEIENIHPPA